MKASTEIEIKVSGGQVTIDAKALASLPDGMYKLVVERVEEQRSESATKLNEGQNNTATSQEDIFVLVEASQLSLNDEFMQYKPRTAEELKLKSLLTNAIKSGLKDFYRPKYDPSFNEDKTEICYEPGKKPAVGKSYKWWSKIAKDFCPERNSRLGTIKEYVAFLGVLIKRLVASGWTVEQAWNAVCINSRELGHYSNSENAKHKFEVTGCREVCGFYDLANTFKILAEDVEDGGCWVAGGYYYRNSYDYPLADLVHNNNRNSDNRNSVGWLVLSE